MFILATLTTLSPSLRRRKISCEFTNRAFSINNNVVINPDGYNALVVATLCCRDLLPLSQQHFHLRIFSCSCSCSLFVCLRRQCSFAVARCDTTARPPLVLSEHAIPSPAGYSQRPPCRSPSGPFRASEEECCPRDRASSTETASFHEYPPRRRRRRRRQRRQLGRRFRFLPLLSFICR